MRQRRCDICEATFYQVGAGRPAKRCSVDCRKKKASEFTRAYYWEYKKQGRRPVHTCRICGAQWSNIVVGGPHFYCGPGCAAESVNAGQRSRYEPVPPVVRECARCGTEFGSNSNDRIRFCSPRCASKSRNRTKNALRRLVTRGEAAEDFDPYEVFDRDEWVCALCDRRIDRTLEWPDPLSVSLDHIVPLSEGGAHSRANTQATHLRCNVSKGAKAMGEQLRLVG